ncbi:MAG TPA: undecaprenyldiphospho-muramoylpentapeptide beta-N-acetylglucosaminyltransferase [Granulicella sp.]|nr:undecaprenyldiphospho-muramoylpentapeptide beta-N-acetylglucosaminyltransferase [Granulicella sp.]
MPDTTPLRILIAGGGTGGHVIPALAIARELRDAHAAEVKFVGTARGLETRLVPEAGFPLELIHVGQLKNVSLLTRARTLTDLPRGILRCISLLRSYQPHVVVGVGGYASGPAMMAALLLRIPTLAFEPNAAPGLANRLVGRYVSAAAVNFDETRRYFRNAKVTGIPVRPAFFELQPKPPSPAKRLLVFGGSQGARILNEILPQILFPLLRDTPGLTVLHQSGPRAEAATRQDYLDTGADESRWQVSAYLDDMPARFADADLILCRSGASTMAELAAAGKPSLLVPFAAATDDHQRKNAEAFVAARAARMLLESELAPQRLLDTLRDLLTDPATLASMSAQARTLAHPTAVQTIAQMIRTLAGPSKGR